VLWTKKSPYRILRDTRSEVTVYEMKRAEKEVSGSRDSQADIGILIHYVTSMGSPISIRLYSDAAPFSRRLKRGVMRVWSL